MLVESTESWLILGPSPRPSSTSTEFPSSTRNVESFPTTSPKLQVLETPTLTSGRKESDQLQHPTRSSVMRPTGFERRKDSKRLSSHRISLTSSTLAVVSSIENLTRHNDSGCTRYSKTRCLLPQRKQSSRSTSWTKTVQRSGKRSTITTIGPWLEKCELRPFLPT